MLKGLMLVNNNVEDGEALFTRALLIRSGIDIDTFTLESKYNISTAYNLEFKVDYKIDELDYKKYDFLVIPGGAHVFNWVGKSEKLNKIINYFNNSNKLIAAICAAPLLLSDANILKNKNYTVFPSVEKEIKDGNYEKDSKVIKDGNIITARSAGVIYEFVFEIVKTLKNEEKLKKLQKSIVF